MLANPGKIILDFCGALERGYHINLEPGEIIHELRKAPIRSENLNLMPGKGAVYVFSLTERANAPAGFDRVLKVGKVGPKNQNRFKYQHYRLGPSTLAGSIKALRILWDYIGVNKIAKRKTDIGHWLIENTDRDHFFMSNITLETNSQRVLLLNSFEYYVKGILGPVFEG